MGRGIDGFRVRQGEFGGMQVVGQGNRREQKGEDANQSDEALPFAAARRAGAKLRQPPQAPHEQKSRGDDQPDRVEEKFHAALILEQAAARGNWRAGRVHFGKHGPLK